MAAQREPLPHHTARLDEAGFSLAEVMIASLIMIVISSALYSGLAQTQVFWESYSDDMDLRQKTRVAIDQITDELRMVGYDPGNIIDVLTQANDTTIQFIADVDVGDDTGPCDAALEGAEYGGAERITYTLDAEARTLMRSVDCWDGATWTVGTAAAPALTDLDPNTAIFRFMDLTGTQIPFGGGTLDADARTDVRSVVVVFDLVETGKTQQVGDVNTNFRLETQVRLHNLEQPIEAEEVVGAP